MFDPNSLNPNYPELRSVVVRHLLRVDKIDEQIFDSLGNAFSKALERENMLLSRPWKDRLQTEVMKAVLEDMLRQLDSRTKTE